MTPDSHSWWPMTVMAPQGSSLLETIVLDAFRRFDSNLQAALPRASAAILDTLYGVPKSHDARAVLTAPSFPHYVLPYWLSPAEAAAKDVTFQGDVVYSTINGSYSVRLSDNIADGDCPEALRKLAPCAAYFDSEFLRPYMRYFPSDHAFWDNCDRYWRAQAEASVVDALLDDVDEETFAQVSSRKFSATKVPVAAIGLRYGHLGDRLETWLGFVDLLGEFTQFNNDFFDWSHDQRYGITTFVSSEARRRRPESTVFKWFADEGFSWGADALRTRFRRLHDAAETLDNPSVIAWLKARGEALDSDIRRMRNDLDLVRTFGRITTARHPRTAEEKTS